MSATRPRAGDRARTHRRATTMPVGAPERSCGQLALTLLVRAAILRAMKRAGLVLLFLFLCVPPIHGAAADKAAQIDAVVSRYTDYGLFSGAVLVSEHDHVIFKKGYGLANREWNIPNAPDVKFRIASVTKQFTSMLVMQQVAKGTIRLDAHLSDYLPYCGKDAGSRVTIHHLLNHTSGIPSYTDDPRWQSDNARVSVGHDDFAKQFCGGTLQFEPGAQYHYNNSGYYLLGTILEHVTGKSYEQLLHEQILDPLGMHDTGYDHTDTILPKRASGYQVELDVVNAPFLEMAQPFAAGGMYSTVENLYKWDQALYSDKLLPATLREKMFTAGLQEYGYGWRVSVIPASEPGAGNTVVQHGGGINGFGATEVRLLRDHNLVVALNNTPGAHLVDMADAIVAILYGREPVLQKRPISNVVADTIRHRGVEAAVAQYRELKRTDPNGYDFAERWLENLGAMLAGHNRTADAIAIMRLNVEQYPQSARGWERLAGVCFKGGEKQLAIESYRRTLELDPQNERAKDRLRILESQK
jgi:CubicO group peptidase (beta-lactamase class C family)